MRDEEMKQLFEEINNEGLTTDSVQPRMKMTKTVYSQETNKIRSQKERG
jgi:hypothetical protein